MLFIDADACAAHLPFGRLVPALREAFRRPCEAPLRHTHVVHDMGDEVGRALIMPAWSARYFGIKTVMIFPGNGARGLPGLYSTYQLYDVATGRPLAALDGDTLTSRRTAAASALAADSLARRDASRLLVVGGGRVAALLPRAFDAVRQLREVCVWNRRRESSEALAAQWRSEGFAVTVADDLETAVRAADIVSCATLSQAPLVRGAWLRPGTHLDLIGSFTPAMRETDAACFDGSEVYVDTDEAALKAGDLLAAFEAGVLTREAIRGDLAALCRVDGPVRRDERAITVFKAVGNAREDLATVCPCRCRT